MVCPVCKGEGINSIDALMPLLSAYCEAIDDCRRKWPNEPRHQKPPLVNSLLRRVRWAETALRFNKNWEAMRALKDEAVRGEAFILTVEAMRSCRPPSDAFELVQARVLFNRDGTDSDTIYLLFPAGCPGEVARRLEQNRFSRMQVLAFDAGPQARDEALVEFDSGDGADGAGSSSISADEGLITSFREQAANPKSARRVLSVANSRVIRPGAIRAVSTPERAVYKPPPRRCPEYG
jgi:hypothetical protein